jgi:aerobic-type carbon monoxide dehydrogenase small subunit (CoxS/CutS family)
MELSFSVNGRIAEVSAPATTPLLEVLRESLSLRGAKPGCGEGRCGACTVLVDGEPIVSCLYPVALADGRAVRTVEGLAPPDGPIAPLQDALLEYAGVQCGACTPGILMSLTALFDRDPAPDEEQIRQALAGNICRCTGYRTIIDAALAVAAEGRR